MRIKSSDEFLTNRAWLQNAVGGKNLILRCASALEYLQMFVGYIGEDSIEVYSMENGEYENIEYRIVTGFDNIRYFQDNGVLCSTFEQAVNDMLKDFKNADLQALYEALATYYHSHKNSFDDLTIDFENIGLFEEVKKQAVLYFCGG